MLLKTIVQGVKEKPGTMAQSGRALAEQAWKPTWSRILTSTSIALCMSATTALLSVEEKTHGRLLAVILAQSSGREPVLQK